MAEAHRIHLESLERMRVACEAAETTAARIRDDERARVDAVAELERTAALERVARKAFLLSCVCSARGCVADCSCKRK